MWLALHATDRGPVVSGPHPAPNTGAPPATTQDTHRRRFGGEGIAAQTAENQRHHASRIAEVREPWEPDSDGYFRRDFYFGQVGSEEQGFGARPAPFFFL